jgi:GT2 family glycosyltransferase
MFEKMGEFDTKYLLSAGEDRDFCDKGCQSGYKMALIKEAVVYHSYQMTLIGFWNQHFTYGRSAYWFLRQDVLAIKAGSKLNL